MLVIGGCADDHIGPIGYDDPPPAAPTGLNSITGDGYVYLYWYLVGENDISGYNIYRSTVSYDHGFSLIATVDFDQDDFTDNRVTNGQTYYYRLTAFDHLDQESDMSYYAMDTPCPQGSGVTIYDFHDASHYPYTGFDLYMHERVAYDDMADCDFYLEYDDAADELIIRTRHDDYYIQDFGYAEYFDDAGYSPESGWSSTNSAEAIDGHIYYFRLRHFDEWHYAKIWIERLNYTSHYITFSWAYQIDADNRELKIAPGAVKHSVGSSAPIAAE